jgi:hypothetical protein
MVVWLFNLHSFRKSCRIEVSVSKNQHEGLVQNEATLVDLKRRRQLDGIISTKKSASHDPHGLVHEGCPNPDDVPSPAYSERGKKDKY